MILEGGVRTKVSAGRRSFSGRTASRWVWAGVLVLLGAGQLLAQTRLLRFPDVHEDQVVFCYAGDLWLVSSRGGTALRLTAHPGLELFPKFSPDGKWVAFTGQYDGDEQVYVISVQGGMPRQLTFYPARGPLPPRWGYDHQVYGWSRDGRAVLFRSLRDTWTLSDSRLYLVPLEGGLPQPLPMPVSGAGDFSPDGRQMVYSPRFRDFRTWKRYQGGWAQDLYLFDLERLSARRITDFPRTERDPMWLGEKIYFASDQDGTLNLYSYDVATGELQQVTHSRPWDVRWPSSDNSHQIVYELQGELHLLDVRSGRSRALPIHVPNDGVAMRPGRVDASRHIEDYSLSPKGERALFVARGDVFSAPIKEGPTRNLTSSSQAHDKWARWSPDGQKIAFISDRSGEEELYLVSQDGSGDPDQLTQGGQAMRYAPAWSPDGNKLAFSDKNGKLFVLRLQDRSLREIADDAQTQIRDYRWSPDGTHLAFSQSLPSGFRRIMIWSESEEFLRPVTSPYFNCFQPSWDPKGNYLYYLSDREFAPQLGSFEWNYLVNRETGIFALALRKDVKPLFPLKSDEVQSPTGGQEGQAKKEEAGSQEKPPLAIDFEGLAERVTRIPVEAANYVFLEATRDFLVYRRTGASYYGRSSEEQPSLRLFSLQEREEKVLAEGVSGAALSADGSKVLIRQGNQFFLLEVSPNGGKTKQAVSTQGLQSDRIPAQEWAQIFDEVWRRYRDFFYVENMHGYDWEALRQRYRPLLQHVAHRADLNYLIGEMIAELNVSHAYIAGGDYEQPARPQVALPGARFELDAASGRYRIQRVLRGQNEEERYRAPLTEIGVEVREGDYVLEVDGRELRAPDNPYRLLRFKAEYPVTLTVSSQPGGEGARKVTFLPRNSETELLYLEWVERNRRRVEQLSLGRVGYLHVPDMGADGIREFIKWYYGQIRKEGLVIDVRNNGGGNVSQMLIERLRRKLLGVGFSRNSDLPGTYPAVVFHGHLVCLLNENSGSDGDIFPWMFREAGLGPLIGKRSWGGVIGITNRGPLLDGGIIYVPEFGNAAADGSWAIEGHGVDPDIEVENDPEALIEGRDPQLERGVREILERIEREPRRLPARPPAPVKTG